MECPQWPCLYKQPISDSKCIVAHYLNVLYEPISTSVTRHYPVVDHHMLKVIFLTYLPTRLATFLFAYLLRDRMVFQNVNCWCHRKAEAKKAPEPAFRNPKVAHLFTKWRQVWLMAMERRRKLQDALDHQNEVKFKYPRELLFRYFL